MRDTEQYMSSEHHKFIEHRISRGEGNLYARDYAGTAPAFVLMHGFPDNLHIWDDLIPYLLASGRRVVTFDFLGFGASDKPSGVAYSFRQQLGDLEEVVKCLGLGTVVPVAHGSSGMATLNYALNRPANVDPQLKNASLTVILAGHWLQPDEPVVAKAMLS
jgi:pimeloyl-ACP methyl ester carboxylesterase